MVNILWSAPEIIFICQMRARSLRSQNELEFRKNQYRSGININEEDKNQTVCFLSVLNWLQHCLICWKKALWVSWRSFFYQYIYFWTQTVHSPMNFFETGHLEQMQGASSTSEGPSEGGAHKLNKNGWRIIWALVARYINGQRGELRRWLGKLNVIRLFFIFGLKNDIFQTFQSV